MSTVIGRDNFQRLNSRQSIKLTYIYTMEEFKTGRPIGKTVRTFLLLILASLVVTWLITVFDQSPEGPLKNRNPAFLGMIGVTCLLWASMGLFLKTHPPVFIKVDEDGIIALKISRTRIPWTAVQNIQYGTNAEERPGLHITFEADFEGLTKKFLFVDGYHHDSEEIIQSITNGFKIYGKSK